MLLIMPLSEAGMKAKSWLSFVLLALVDSSLGLPHSIADAASLGRSRLCCICSLFVREMSSSSGCRRLTAQSRALPAGTGAFDEHLNADLQVLQEGLGASVVTICE